MSVIVSILSGIGSLFSWLTGYSQRKAGAAEQREADDTSTVETLKREQQAGTDAPATKADVIKRLDDGSA